LLIQKVNTAQMIVDRLFVLPISLFDDFLLCQAVAYILLIITMCGKISIFTSSSTMDLVGRIIEKGNTTSTNSVHALTKFMADQHVCSLFHGKFLGRPCVSAWPA
jgi:hypothetical protein